MTRDTTRREFLQTLTLAGAAIGLGGVTAPGLRPAWASTEAPAPLKVLVLGGTGQTGPHLVADLLARGHTVTMLNRGNRSDELFPDVECIIGDRQPDSTEGLAALRTEIDGGRAWDACVDVWPHIPRIVENTAALLQGSVGRYLFVSSISVYTDNSQPGQDETAPVGEAPDADTTEYTNEVFGPFKAECENRVRRYYPDNHTIIRPGLIVGPRDFSFRGGYWPVRVRRGGEVLAPGDGTDRIQVIDGRDLTAFETRCLEQGLGGTFNVIGPHPSRPLTMQRYLETCREASASSAELVWVDADFLEEQGVGAWRDMPCWIPAEGDHAGFGSRSVNKAFAAGLTVRPLVDTLRDTLAWYDELPAERRESVTNRAGLTPERETAVLAAWRATKR
ncbi:MAG TPA: NAD-dependent epimerase/dehydratase family protein [Candidatus Krumholzibacteria bacterium]|nr:NAD-dependent epimerase/dehydratase family protein [Candidatus Krumholzibacteria bacterium]HPD71783.1 NAD-dependent epimerase/dehydratase family protein [Candidatus Krumholzibacteria bacterium]HRY41284.1 NAD-dependent epimerase/dehydratase family protein [Candidatus Krumholzibacteria bacterium]